MQNSSINIHNSKKSQSLPKVFSLSQCTKTIRSVLAKSFLCMSYSALSIIPVFAVDNSQLNTLITQAIETHPSIGAAKAEQQATTEGIQAAKLNLLPQPSFSAGYNSDNDLVSHFNIRQNLWTGGRLTASVNQAVFDDKAAMEHIFEAQNEVAKTTIDAWQSYITAVSLQKVYLNSLKRLDDFEKMMTRRVNQGVSARIELDLVTNRILQEQNAYQGALEQQRIAVARLEQIIGQPFEQGSVPNLADLVQQAKLQASNFENIVFDELSFSNPTVVKQRYQVAAAKQEVKTKEAARYPTVYAQYQYTYYLKDKKDDNKFSLGLDYQPGAGFSDKALTRASMARVKGLEQSEEAVRRKALENIQVQYQQFISARDQELSLVAAVSGAQIVLNSYQRQFIAGRKSWLDVLNAAREQSQYDVQLVNTRANLLGAFYKLQVDFGMMDWQEFQNNREPVIMFHPFDPIKAWLNKHDLVKNTAKDVSDETDANGDFDNNNLINPTLDGSLISESDISDGIGMRQDMVSDDYMPYTEYTTVVQNENLEHNKNASDSNEKNTVSEKIESGKRWLKDLFNHKKQEDQLSQPSNENLENMSQPEILQDTSVLPSSHVSQHYNYYEQNSVKKNDFEIDNSDQEVTTQVEPENQIQKQQVHTIQELTYHPEIDSLEVQDNEVDEERANESKKKVSFAQKLLQKVSQKNLLNTKIESTELHTESNEPQWALLPLEQLEKVDLKLNVTDNNVMYQ